MQTRSPGDEKKSLLKVVTTHDLKCPVFKQQQKDVRHIKKEECDHTQEKKKSGEKTHIELSKTFKAHIANILRN